MRTFFLWCTCIALVILVGSIHYAPQVRDWGELIILIFGGGGAAIAVVISGLCMLFYPADAEGMRSWAQGLSYCLAAILTAGLTGIVLLFVGVFA